MRFVYDSWPSTSAPPCYAEVIEWGFHSITIEWVGSGELPISGRLSLDMDSLRWESDVVEARCEGETYGGPFDMQWRYSATGTVRECLRRATRSRPGADASTFCDVFRAHKAAPCDESAARVIRALLALLGSLECLLSYGEPEVFEAELFDATRLLPVGGQ